MKRIITKNVTLTKAGITTYSDILTGLIGRGCKIIKSEFYWLPNEKLVGGAVIVYQLEAEEGSEKDTTNKGLEQLFLPTNNDGKKISQTNLTANQNYTPAQKPSFIMNYSDPETLLEKEEIVANTLVG